MIAPSLKALLALATAGVLAACASTAPQHREDAGAALAIDSRVVFPATVPQGALVIGKVPAGSTARYGDRTLRATPYGSIVLGIGRDEPGPVRVLVQLPDGGRETVSIAVTRREWPLETIRGAPPATVDPPPMVAARIEREQALVSAARIRDDARTGFAQPFIWPVQGRISGRFGNQRIYKLPGGSDSAGSSHSGMDIAAPDGTPVQAPAAGVVTFADPDLYLTGGTVLLDHGHGVSSNFLHLSRLDVAAGDVVEQGQVIGAVGATGRATGPHLHWGMNWFTVRIDPLLVLERGEIVRAAAAR